MTDGLRPRNTADPERCEPFRELLSAWMDHELPQTLMAAVDRHLETCADCERDLQDLRRTVALVRAVLAPNAPPRRLGGKSRTPREVGRALTHGGRRGRSLPLAAAAVAIALVSSALTWGLVRWGETPTTADDMASRVIELHVRGLTGEHLVEVASSDGHAVKPWFDRHVPFSPAVPQLGALGFPLLGGRVDRIGRCRVAATMYGLRRHVIGVFTWPADGPPSDDTADTAGHAQRGYRALHWVDGDMQYWVVSDVGLADLRAFVVAFRSAAVGGGRDAGQR